MEKLNTIAKSFKKDLRNDRNRGSDSILDDRNKGILEGISSLHSWIKTQTLIAPTKSMSRIRDELDHVSDLEKDRKMFLEN